MGFTGKLIKSVFPRNRSSNHLNTKVRSNNDGVEKRRWVSVKSYFCGDELDSVMAEEDSASVKSSEGTVSLAIHEEVLSGREETKKEETLENDNNNNVREDNGKISNCKLLLNEEEAAILIQSAYRAFQRRRQNEGMKKETSEEEEEEVSMSTSIEVQTGNSIIEPQKVNNNVHHHPCLLRSRSQLLKQKEDWDDSTVTGYVSEMRMQNRMEALTRRERALAYAFSQQLRICSKRKSNKHNTNAESNMSWSWLERWMATRIPDSTASLDHSHCYGNNNNHKFAVRKSFLDSREEKESCGSNDVALHEFDNYSTTSQEIKDHEFISSPSKEKNNLKGRKKIVSRRKTVPS